ncbi:putative e3 ubiquitin-protein ligase ptr1 + rna transporter 1 protein [Phaeoacremonium minimum UCRPA7]|uniref:HECT-type E3 ubiquitin transferase n=1 Tax=Phaeoacremonium minimum (strain UCR-PA7) TaxID=1286976 RepID=R8BJB3_PHAM7|nr:putative e3 ubiquitin-protein ligase ptr1 + rna transporter 1 protein [Phaeoacremonium minimum UCRPA7]EON99369.1 putative e3 ubiquitin-protein ligase ptr1 + rna transporter 1 protein [Phaeoacremonium minimum UCRPA7]
MGKITKTMQPKHKETLSPWLKEYVQSLSSVPLPLLPKNLDTFPTRWPFPRGDLYHWVPLLNRFDNILESFVATYNLSDGPQLKNFGCELLLKRSSTVEFHDDQPWNMERLAELGYGQDGDSQLIIAILKFSRMLLEHCGNRSIYGSSSHLNDLLHSTSLTVVHATLEVGVELAQRYQASVKRMTVPSRQVSSALLANHYNIDLNRVQHLAQPFMKTPIISFSDPAPQTTPTASASKGKEKSHQTMAKNAASMYANDLAIALALLEAISNFQSKYSDILSALNANVNHGVLLYVIRKAVSEMKEDSGDIDDRITESDDWRNNLFSLTLHMAIGSRVGNEMISAGLMDVLVDILNMRSKLADRNHSMVLAFLDGLIYHYQGAFQSFINANGLDSIAELIVDATSAATSLMEAGQGTKQELHSSVVDYDIPFYQQQTLKWLLKFIHHIMTNSYSYGGNTDRLLRNLVDNSHLLGSLRTIMEHMNKFGSVVWTNSVTILSDFINNDPTSFAAIMESGMIKSFLEAVTGRPVRVEQPNERKSTEPRNDEDGESSDESDESVVLDSDDRPHPPTSAILEAPRDGPLAQGILPSAEAISIIPTVLNSICLNNVGMKMVVSSRAFESFLEIFESPEHLKSSQSDPDLAGNVGSSFDELARHHPSLRPAIGNAVLDMVAKVNHLGKKKAVTSGWGTKLLVTGPDGNVVQADKLMVASSAGEAPSIKGKEKATTSEDIEMTDATQVALDLSASQVIPEEQVSTASTYNEITPYILAVATFLSSYIGNSSLKAAFVRDGGIELLLDLTELPSLSYEFGETAASRTLQHVISQLIEHSPIIGLPSLMNRTQAAIDALAPLVSNQNSHPYFAPFLSSDFSLATADGNWDADAVGKVADGTGVVKALLNTQSLIKTLYQCFPFSNRQSTVTLHPVNVFDYYIRVIKSLGPLLQAVLSEEMSIVGLVPQHWSSRKLSTSQDPPGAPTTTTTSSLPADGDVEDSTIPDVIVASPGSKPNEETVSNKLKRPTQQEQSSPQYRNYQVLRVLLHSLMPTTFPFFQTLGKTLLPRRERDAYCRAKHMQIADALAATVLDQIKPSKDEITTKDFHYWIVLLHSVHEMLIDPSRPQDGALCQAIIPVLIAFKEHGGFDTLNTMLRVFAEEITKERAENEDASKARLASIGMKKILDLYAPIVHGKTINVCLTNVSMLPRGMERRPEFAHVPTQLIVELRMAVLPVIRSLWESKLVEKASTQILTKVVDILKTIANADLETNAWRRGDKNPPPPIFKREPVSFAWAGYSNPLQRVADEYDDQDLVREALYRANGVSETAAEYCRVHRAGIAGARCPIPVEDAFQLPPTPEQSDTKNQAASLPVADLLGSEAMLLDSNPELDRLLGEAVLGELNERSSQDSIDSEEEETTESAPPAAHESSVIPQDISQEASSSAQVQSTQGQPAVTKQDLDIERGKLREDLIDRCLEVIRAHPDAVFEVSELINSSVLRHEEEDSRQEVGETLANALMSFAIDEDVKKSSGRSIAAYAHLLSLLLQDSKPFFKSCLETLRDNVSDYVSFLKITPGNATEELPPWIPYILLIFEILLAEDEQPVEAKWTPPANENATIEEPVLQVKNPLVKEEDRGILLEAVLDILPRVGKDESLAIAVLRVLIMLTRNRKVARTVGDKKNLQRLLLMAKQLAGSGSGRLKETKIAGGIMTILRHVVEDDDTIRQIIRYEIRGFFDSPQRNARSTDLHHYLRHLSHVVLRSPELFVEVTHEMVQFSRWINPSSDGTSSRGLTLMLKEQLPDASSISLPTDESVEPAVQATEDLTIHDVKPSTEINDKDILEGAKTALSEAKRPTVENPDGVIHFLLCELLNYRDVDDRDSSQTTKDTKTGGEPSVNPGNGEPSTEDEQSADGKDKKASKPPFKAEDHPIFVYRCFLLHCLAELLQSYNRTKMEFINFKRSAPMLTNTPVKPRSSVLNYLLNDLLCMSSLTMPMDSIASKKKAATSEQARLVLVALVTKTPEKPIDRNRERFAYDDEPDLLFVRKFVLDTIIKAYREASTPNDPFDVRYAKMLSLAELMSGMIGEKDRESANPRIPESGNSRSQLQLKRLMYEKGYLSALTASIADIDLTFPGVKRTIKYILRVLRVLTQTGIQLSHSNILPPGPFDSVDEEIASASSLSDMEDDREDTPDLYRNSTLGMLEPGREDEDFSEDSEDDEEMYDDGYDDELDYGEEMSEDGEENISDDDDEELGEMGEIEGLPGDPGVVEVIMGEDEDMDEDDEDDESSDDEDDEGSEDMDDDEDRIEIVDDEGNPLDDDGASGWESETDDEDDDEDDEDDEFDYEVAAQGLDEAAIHGLERDDIGRLNLVRAALDEDYDGEEMPNFQDPYIDDGGEEDDEEDEEDVEADDEEYIYDQDYPRDDIPPPSMPAGLGWDTLVVEPGFPHRHRHGGMRSPFPVAPFMLGGPRDPLGGHGRDPRSESRRDAYQEPQHAVSFNAEQTVDRWHEEARMIFGLNHHEKAGKMYNVILAKLTPAAVEQEKKAKAHEAERRRKEEEARKKRDEALRKERETREAAEAQERERKEAEERERQEREAAEAAEAAARAEEQSHEAAMEVSANADSQAMEGIESGDNIEQEHPDDSTAQLPRVVTMIRGEEFDVTELGIDPDYLAALPEEFREEVIAQTLTTRRSQAREAAAEPTGENTEVFQEFLDALPEELRLEIVQQERQERRRLEREAQRQAAVTGQAAASQEMDTASILLTFPPDLREQILMEQGEDLMDQLSPEMAAQARALAERVRPPPSMARAREVGRQAAVTTSGFDNDRQNKPQRRTVVQMLDKAGVATLLRLMFVSQQGSIRNYLFNVFIDVCENRQNRLEVISTLLQILQDGSTDMDAVERSFSQLSLKARQPKDKEPKTPNSLKRTYTNISSSMHIHSSSEISPLLIVQQCLDLLVELSAKNPHIPSLFLTEHEIVGSSLKRTMSRKGKGKDSKANKYAINSLLVLLDRDLVMESSSVMQHLADLLNKVTFPLQALERRRKEAEEEAKKAAKTSQSVSTTAPDAGTSTEQASATGHTVPIVTPSGDQTSSAPAPVEAESSNQDTKEADQKKTRQLQPPSIPEHNLKLVIKIFVARECSSKTFQNTISTIKNLSNIPGAKAIFGKELVHQARVLSQNIVSDLDELLPHILKAESGTEIQGIALAKFSPGASEQNKLLRVLTALDHLFEAKGKKTDEADQAESSKENEKADLLGSLYYNATFGKMWEKLSQCLSAIRQRENMLNVATILLPLIESLMVVCKNTTLNDAPQSQSQVSKDMLLSSPPPENRIAGLFFTFTEDHRRILNELVRHNPKLMSGTFSLLVKNPKVLEFDNKRNYFNRSVHSKSGNQVRPSFPPLQLSVRREHVFHDSFKSLYFKSGDEMKFGKLNIRFHGEEGVDAGGVTREWFQVLSRQMFDPNYALFIPVSSDRTTFHPNKLSGINDEHLMFFKFIGRIIGKALYEGRVLDCYFSRAVYKRILGKQVSVKDMESFDPDYYKSLVWMLENDITDIITETFSVEDDEFGVTKIVDLCENGRNIPVTEENKHEYVRLVVDHKLLSSVKDQMENFLKGFHDIIPSELIAIFNEQELELLISGLPDIDVDDWKSNAEYHNYTAASQQIQWFWRAVRSFDKEERAKLLQFVTGTSKVPLNGFKELEGMNGVNRFNIHRDYGNKDRLPSSHTCFNQLDLPEYESYDILRAQLMKAITAGSDYFGFA